jgi:hypothetical protein
MFSMILGNEMDNDFIVREDPIIKSNQGVIDTTQVRDGSIITSLEER